MRSWRRGLGQSIVTTRATSRRYYRDSTSSSRIITAPVSRSEEHTSELQSHSDLVCRLLLEKIDNAYDVANNRASSNFDQRHSLSISYVYGFPFFRGSGFAHTVLGGVQVLGLTLVPTCTPVN